MDLLQIFMRVLAFLSVFFLLMPIISAISHSRRERIDAYFEVQDRCSNFLNSRSIEKVRYAILDLKKAYADAESVLNWAGKEEYSETLSQLQDTFAELEEKQWQKKADPHLENFLLYYESIMNGDMETFSDVDTLFKEKTKCITEWQKYFSVDLSIYETIMYPKRYMRECAGDLYDPCMESHEALEKKLSDKIQYMRPEYRRKARLYDIIVDYVASEQSVMRTKLFTAGFNGFTDEEVKICYRALLKKNRLVEIKLGNRLFVTLSDKEQIKRDNKANHADNNGGDIK